jgi:hypothetical protein
MATVNTKDLSTQLELTEKISQQMKQISATAEETSKSISSQVNAMVKISNVLKSMKTDDVNEGFRQMQENAKKLDDSMSKLGDVGVKSTKKLSGSIDEVGRKLIRTSKTALVFSAAWTGIQQGFQNTVAMTKAVAGFFSTAISFVSQLTMSIISIPFKIFKGLIKMSQEGSSGMNELLVQIEKVREQFGQLSGTGAKAILDTTKTLKGFSDTGLSAFRIFGFLHERMQFIREMAEKMGAAFEMLAPQMEEHGGHILAYMKGLGLTGEQMRAVYERANQMGASFVDLGKDVTKYSYAMSEKFGISAKLISRDMGKALQDVKHFAGATTKQIAIASTYARKLGLELEKIVGTLDAFETFDTAAENVAKLSQSFGVSLDTYKLVAAQDPASQVDMLRKSFREAGKDAASFTRQELKLLSTSIGLDESTTRAAFSLKNAGVSMKDLQKEGVKAEKQQLSQAEAMQKLAGAIERMVKSGGPGGFEGFFDAFMKGVDRGIRSSVEFRKVMINLRWALRTTWFEGMKLGLEIPKLFPGLKEFSDGLANVFQPAKFQKNAENVRKAFQSFFKGLTTGEASLDKLGELVRKSFFQLFDSTSEDGQKTIRGFKTMFLTITKIVGMGIEYVGKLLSKGMTALADMITNPQSLLEKVRANAAGGKDFMSQALLPTLEAFEKVKPQLKVAIWKLMLAVKDKMVEFFHSETFRKIMKTVGPTLIAIMFGPAVIRGLLAAGVSMMSTVMSGVITRGLATGSLAKLFSTGLGKVFVGATGIGALLIASKGVSDGFKKYRENLSKEFNYTDATIASGTAGLIDTLTFGLMPDWLSESLAKKIAQLSKSLRDMLNKAFVGLGDSTMTFAASFFELLGSIGDTLSAIFDGDSEKIELSIKKLGLALLQAVTSFAGFVVNTMLALAKQLYKALFGTFSAIAGLMADGARALGLDKIASVFDGLKSVLTKVGEYVAKILDFVGGKISKFFKDVSGTFTMIKSHLGWASDTSKETEKNLDENNKTLSEKLDDSAKIVQQKSADISKGFNFNMLEGMQGGKGPLIDKNITQSLEFIDSKFDEKKTADMSKNVDAAIKFVENSASKFESLSGMTKKVMTSVETSGIIPALEAAQKMVDTANKLNDAMSEGNIAKMKVMAGLTNVANAVGVGGKANYKIENKGVNITVDVTVIMKAADVEKALIQRAESIIRNRLNNAKYDTSTEKAPSSIPRDANSPSPAMIPGED